MRLFEPCIPSPQAWDTLLQHARLYRIRGAIANAVVVLRGPDAAVLAAALFGEAEFVQAPERRLSPLECDVLDRMVNAFAANLGTVCGAREGRSVELVTGILGFVTYFELLVTNPVMARIGIALSRDPSPECGATLDAAVLSSITVTARASLDLGRSDLASVARLKPGDVIALARARVQRCVLLAESRGIAHGAAGVRNGRYSVAVDGRA
jgi:flagellar motor switch protein FliM